METIEQQLNNLKKIKRVEVPEYLDNRILQKVTTLKNTIAPKTWKISIAAAAIILLLLNLGIVMKITVSHKNTGLKQFGTAMGLSTSNDLYND